MLGEGFGRAKDNHMLDTRLLEILSEQSGPIGAATVYAILADEMATSEATIGRRLRTLDRVGFTTRIGRQGRLMTERGRRHLLVLHTSARKSEQVTQLLKALEADTIDKLMQVLEARILLEGPIAALAAQRATAQQLVRAEGILSREDQPSYSDESVRGQDMAFHRLVAEMSGNKVLEKALELIRMESDLSPYLSAIRREMGHRGNDRSVLEAIRSRDAKRAKDAMVKHVEAVKRDVMTYWEKLHPECRKIGFEDRLLAGDE